MKTQRLFVVFGFVVSSALSAFAQNQGLPQGWDSLSATDFAKAVEKRKTQGPLAPELKSAIGKQAVGLLFTSDQTLDQLTYADIGNLLRYARPQLTQAQSDLIRQRVLNREDGQMSFKVMRNKVEIMTLSGVPDENKRSLVANWVRAGHLEKEKPDLSPTNAFWLYEMLSHPLLENGSFSVVWTGNLQAPRDGSYVFSLPPINMNSKWKNMFIQVEWKVAVDGKEVLHATPDRWTTESAAVELTADKPVKFRAEANFNVSRPMQNEIYAMLYWRGPGISTSIVPNESWTTPDGSTRGLMAEYRGVFEGNKNPQTISRVDPTIDFNWAMDRILAPRYAKEHQRAANFFRDQFTTPAYLDRCAKGKSEHPFLIRPLAMAECLTTPQRREFLKEVLQRKEMLAPLNAKEATSVFAAFRLGAENEALDVYGSWCTLQRDLAPDLPKQATAQNLLATNRLAFIHISHQLKEEYPALLKTLEDKYLQTPDGSCSLPAAYTLAYGYQVQRKIDVWIQSLKIKLAEANLTGPARVNWLIARAMAEEIRLSSANRYSVAAEDLTAGLNWLKSAEEAAGTNEQRLQVLKEFVARDIALNHFDVAKTRLETAANATQKGRAQDAIRLLGVQADRIDAKIRKRGETDADAALVAYRTEIQRRQQVASNNGDDSEAARLEQLLDEAK